MDPRSGTERRRPTRPPRLRPGDTIAVVSPSWGGPAVFPHVYERGLHVLRSLGLAIRELPSTRRDPAELAGDPEARAADINAAFADRTIAAIVTSIGGDDSIRLLRYLETGTIRANPKILLGFSDTTTLLTFVRRAGVVTFHGPSVMAGLSQADALPAAFLDHVRTMLFEPASELTYPSFGSYVEGYPDWRDPANVGRVNEPQLDDGWHVLQGLPRVVEGELFGGCLDVLDWLRGTGALPEGDEWDGRLLFLEPSEEKPTADQVRRIIRSFGAVGVFDRVDGVLLGRPRDHDADEARAFESAVVDVVTGELRRPDLPIVANLPFGHTDPQWILPIGVRARLEPADQRLTLVEPWLD